MAASSSGDPLLLPPPDDRISNLDDDILHLILSKISLQEAIRTSVLSPRWRHCWCTNPSLSLTIPPKLSSNPWIYASIVDSCLKACDSASKIKSMSVRIDSEVHGSIYRRWIGFAADKSVESLSLTFQHVAEGEGVNFDDPDEFKDYIDSIMKVPVKIFSLSSLTFLHLEQCELPVLPSYYLHAKAAFPNLVTLLLEFVVLNKDTLSGFISTSPKLRNLKISVAECQDKISISCPTLVTLNICKNLLLVGYNTLWEINCRVEIVEAPKLKGLLLCYDLENVDLTGLKDSTQLEAATMFCLPETLFSNLQSWTNVVSCIRGVQTLSVDYWLLEHVLSDDNGSGNRFPIFVNLKHLKFHCNTYADKWAQVVIGLLKETPLLEKLEFDDDCSAINRDLADDYNFENEDIFEKFKDCANIARNLKSIGIWGHYAIVNVVKLMYFISSRADKLEKVDIDISVCINKDYFGTWRGLNRLLELKWISSRVKINTVYV